MSYHFTALIKTRGYYSRHLCLPLFKRKCRRPMEVQLRFLRQLLKEHRDTGFGRQYDFASISSLKEFQERIPIHEWDDLLPYMERVYQGEKTALFPENERLLMYGQTSGTTRNAKLIPVTETSFRHYEKYWGLFWQMAKYLPWIPNGKILCFPGNPEEGSIGGVPYGAITGKLLKELNPFLKRLFPYPQQICLIENYSLRYYTVMRLALEGDVSMVYIPNPSTILKLFQTARLKKDQLIEDIEQGVLRDAEKMPRDFVAHVQKRLRPNPARASQLRTIVQRSGDFLPKDYWPHPIGVFCFAAGPLELYLQELEKYHPLLRVGDLGLLASEGRFSFPVCLYRENSGCPLTIDGNFFEFMPYRPGEKVHQEALALDQVELGEKYYLIVTNYSGLYRYNIHDVVQVVGFYENTPLITFCHKGVNFSNITGEKISEIQIVESVKRAREKLNLGVSDFVMCLHWDVEDPYYSLIMANESRKTSEEYQEFINVLEGELMAENSEYLSKRKSQRLGPLTLKLVSKADFQDFEARREKTVSHLTQYKQSFLVNEPSFEKQFHFEMTFPSELLTA